MSEETPNKKSIDILAAVGAAIAAVGCVAIVAFGDLSPAWEARVEGWSEVLGLFFVGALGRYKLEAPK